MPRGKRHKNNNWRRKNTASVEHNRGEETPENSKHPDLCQRNIETSSLSRDTVNSSSLVSSDDSAGHSNCSFNENVDFMNRGLFDHDKQEQSKTRVNDKDDPVDVVQQTSTQADDKFLLDITESATQDRTLQLLTENHSFSQTCLNKALILACQRGYQDLVQKLVCLGADVQYKDTNGNTPLLICVENGFIDIVRFLLTRKADVNAANYAGNTALILSLRLPGSAEMLKVLLEQPGININHQNQHGYTALMTAVEVKDINAMKLLLDKPYVPRVEKASHVAGSGCAYNDEIVNNKGQAARDIAETCGLGNVFRILHKHGQTGTSPLLLAFEDKDTESFNILLICLFLDINDKKRSIDEAFRNIFERCRLKAVQTLTDNEYEMIERLLGGGADVSSCYFDYNPVSVAVKTGNYRLVEVLCKHGLHLKQHWYESRRGPLQTAAEIGRCDLIELLLSYKADVNQKFSGSAIDWALRNGQIDCAKFLIKHGATLDIKQALMSAVRHQKLEYMNFLLENFKQEAMYHFQENIDNIQHLLISAVQGGNLEIIAQILDAGADINRPTDTGIIPLVESKNGEVAKFLIKRGADVNQMIDNVLHGSITPLIQILTRRCESDFPTRKLVQVLLENGASANGRLRDGRPALMLAAFLRGNVDMLQISIEHGADLCGTDEEGNTILIRTILGGFLEYTSYVLQFINTQDFLNIRNHRGSTALMCAVDRQELGLVRELLKLGADVNVKDVNGDTALMLALTKRYRGQAEMLAPLINAGSDVNCQNNDGMSPLMLAATYSWKDAAQILLDSGADVNAVSNSDPTRTALSCLPCDSSFRRDTEICMEYLLERGARSSNVSPLALVQLILHGYVDLIPKLIRCGLGPPADINHEDIYGLKEIGVKSNVSPLCVALLVGNVALARYFMGKIFLTNSDVSSLAGNKDLRSFLESRKYQECLTFFDELSSQPLSLVKLCLVAVSSAVGASLGRENRVNLLPMPQKMKDILVFKTEDNSLLQNLLYRDRTLDRSWIYRRPVRRCVCARLMSTFTRKAAGASSNTA